MDARIINDSVIGDLSVHGVSAYILILRSALHVYTVRWMCRAFMVVSQTQFLGKR